MLDEGEGTPAIVARHAGREHAPEELRDAPREAATVALAGNPVAPLTPRYALRDLAVELGAPVVVTVGAEPSLTGQARLYAEAVRAAGLPVAAIVIVDWPDPPDRVLLDERVLLHEVTALPVLTLRRASARSGRVEDWKATEPLAGAGAVKPQRVSLEPYREWLGESPGDPRSAPRPRIMEAMLDIVAAEGPILATRAYAVYNRAAGGKKLTIGRPRAALELDLPPRARGQGRARRARTRSSACPTRPPSSSASSARASSIEVPLDEIAELMRRLGDQPDLKRAVLNTYGLMRMTARAEQYLAAAEALL